MAELDPQSAGDFEAQLRAEAAGLGLITPLSPLELARRALPAPANFLEWIIGTPAEANAAPQQTPLVPPSMPRVSVSARAKMQSDFNKQEAVDEIKRSTAPLPEYWEKRPNPLFEPRG